jgi:hypothetical protein
MAKTKVRVEHPLLDRLHRLNREAARRFPDPIYGLWHLGLRLNDLDKHRYPNWTPLNCRTFAFTGGEGVHFSFLVQQNLISENSPVIITIPPMESWVVGESLFDFLCLGRHRGYFALEQLAYHQEVTLKVYTEPDWQPSASWHDSVGYVVDDTRRQLLDWLASELNLSPWTSAARFHDLQERFRPLLELPPYPE